MINHPTTRRVLLLAALALLIGPLISACTGQSAETGGMPESATTTIMSERQINSGTATSAINDNRPPQVTAVPGEPHVLSQAAPGITIADGRLSALGGFIATADQITLLGDIRPTGKLSLKDYELAYTKAISLTKEGYEFRRYKLQLLPCTTPDKCLENYSDFNGGELFYQFCADYNRINESGGCPQDGDDQDGYRTKLVHARDLFGFLATADPSDLRLPQGEARTLGRTGVLSATDEIVNIHLIFGNEFMVDALDYRFSGPDLRADAIIDQEIDLLQQAVQQYKLSLDLLAYTFNADLGGPTKTHITNFFTAREYDLFGVASERYITALAEIAARYRQLGQDQKALDLYASAFREQYVQALALAQNATDHRESFLAHGGWRLLNNFERLRAQAQVINDKINPFGFTDDYVPLQTYEYLQNLTQQLLDTAGHFERDAAGAQRDFDQNATAVRKELKELRDKYDARLAEICGPKSDYYRETCDDGLMNQDLLATRTLLDRIRLAHQRAADIPHMIEIVREGAGLKARIRLATGEEIAAIEFAKGVENAYRVTESTATSDSWNVYANTSVNASASASVKGSWNPFGCFIGGCAATVEATLTHNISAGGGWSHARVSSSESVWDPEQIKLGKFNSLEAVRQAEADALITNTDAEQEIRRLLLEQADKLIEVDIAMDEYREAIGKHNNLVAQYKYWLNQRRLAEEDLVSSYLNNPAYRILRDSLTIEAAGSLARAAQFAYLTAKAREYETLKPIGYIGDIFKARTAGDIQTFLDELKTEHLLAPGDLNRFRYRISVAKDIVGLTDEYLNPEGMLNSTEVAKLRIMRFRDFLQKSQVKNCDTCKPKAVEFHFTISLLDRIFSSDIWNRRIAGVGLPAGVPDTQGVRINLVTNQFGDPGAPEILLTQGGQATYRNAQGKLVTYSPANARLAGYTVPPDFSNKTKTGVIQASIKNTGGTPSSAFFNFSVAASDWTLRISLQSSANQKLDVSQLEDMEIVMDTTGYAIQN